MDGFFREVVWKFSSDCFCVLCEIERDSSGKSEDEGVKSLERERYKAII